MQRQLPPNVTREAKEDSEESADDAAEPHSPPPPGMGQRIDVIV